jgi:hypothetical protein
LILVVIMIALSTLGHVWLSWENVFERKPN